MSVDTSLYPSATGAAAEFAGRHAAEHPLKLYGGWFCPFVQRAWMTLHEKRIPHQYVEINPYLKAPEFLALNPRGLVPTLAVPPSSAGGGEEGGKAQERKPLYDSLVICEYLDEAYADEARHGPRLLPDDAYERARCRLWIDHVSTRIVPRFYRLLQHTPDNSYSIDSAREELRAQIAVFMREMASREAGPWFLGGRFSLVDIALAPWAYRLFLIDHYKTGGVGIPPPAPVVEEQEEKEVWDRWRIWFDAVMARPSMRETLSERDAYIEAYKRYVDDTTMSEVARATRHGRGLP